MAEVGKSANISLEIDGQSLDGARDLNEIKVLASFDDGSVQANISSESFNLVGPAAQYVQNYFYNGGAFEGLPIKIKASNINTQIVLLDSILDFTNEFQIINTGEVRASVEKKDGLNSLERRLEGITFGLLETQGFIGNYVDVDYLVIKEDNELELITLQISTFLLTKELIDSIKKLADFIKDSLAHAAGGVTGPAASAIWIVATIIIEVIFIALIIVALYKLTKQIVELLIPTVKTHKAISLRQGLAAICAKLGYNLVSNISYLDSVHYLPSKPKNDEAVQSGIPNVSDFGFQASEFFQLCKKMFLGRYAVIGNELHFRTEFDPFWITTSTFVMQDNLELESFSYNLSDHKSNILISFEFDESDKWTMENFTGTNYEVIERPAYLLNDQNALTKGFEPVRIPCSLGNRKDELTVVEKSLKVFAKLADKMVNLFGGNSNLEAKIKDRIGVLKVSQNQHFNPKLLYLQNGKLPSNHRDLWKAKILWENFLSYKSFLLNNFYGQKKLYRNVRIGFGMENFIELSENSYFTTPSGQVGKMERIEWTTGRDYAVCDFWIREPFTQNLAITTNEP